MDNTKVLIVNVGFYRHKHSGFVIHSTNDNQDTHEIGSIGFVIRNLAESQPNRKSIGDPFIS